MLRICWTHSWHILTICWPCSIHTFCYTAHWSKRPEKRKEEEKKREVPRAAAAYGRQLIKMSSPIHEVPIKILFLVMKLIISFIVIIITIKEIFVLNFCNWFCTDVVDFEAIWKKAQKLLRIHVGKKKSLKSYLKIQYSHYFVFMFA